MIPYTCLAQKHGATRPIVKHPCGVAAKLTGQEDVPVLVTEDGTVVRGSRRIVGWARGAPPA